VRDTIRVSELSTWLRCRRKAWLAYEEGWEIPGTMAGIGTAVHTRLAEYYGGVAQADEYDKVKHLTPEDWGMVDAIMDTYMEEAESEGLGIGQRTVFVEKRLSMNIGGVQISGQIDHLVHDDVLGGYLVRDHKTVAQFQKTADVDFQLMCYALLVQDWALTNEHHMPEVTKVVAVEHNQIKRNKRTARSKPPYIDRQTRLVTYDMLYRFRKQLEHIVSDYQNVMYHANDVHDHALYAVGRNDCSWSCDFSDVCGMIDSGDDYRSVLESEFTEREAPVDIT